MKYCPSCDSYKEDYEFSKNSSNNCGLDTYCKICHSNKLRELKTRRLTNGLCIKCGNCNPDKNLTTCENCRIINNTRNKEYRVINVKKRLLYNTKKNAKERNMFFDINENDIDIPEYCPVLGIRLNYNNSRSLDDSPSIDRIDSNIGYVSGNVKVVSMRANRGKSNLTAEEHRAIADWIDMMEDENE